MRVLALGGAGEYGRRAASILASSNLVSEIVIAGRNLEAAQSCAKEIGEKATAVSVDVSDRDGLVALAKDCEIVVNTTGPEYETVLKVLEAAISSGTDYCDVGADGPTMEAALELDSAAKAKGVTALMGIGACPGIATLMMVHAARQLDRVEEVRSCALFEAAAFGITRDGVRGYRETRHLSAGWQMTMKWGTPPFHICRGGSLVTVKDKTDEMRIAMPGNGEIPALLVGSTEAVTIPRSVPGIRNVYTLLSWFPFQLNGIYRELGGRVAKGELDESQAALAFLDQAVTEQERLQPAPTGFPKGIGRWAEAVGTKDGNRTTYSCWPTPGWYGPDSTGVALALAALKILGSEIRTHGVLSPESCLDPLPFFKEVARQKLKTDEPGKLLNETWRTL
jgi:saccharopine dehydrogenase-like NADP-dependent oxidoreductase